MNCKNESATIVKFGFSIWATNATEL